MNGTLLRIYFGKCLFHKFSLDIFNLNYVVVFRCEIYYVFAKCFPLLLVFVYFTYVPVLSL